MYGLIIYMYTIPLVCTRVLHMYTILYNTIYCMRVFFFFKCTSRLYYTAVFHNILAIVRGELHLSQTQFNCFEQWEHSRQHMTVYECHNKSYH